MQTKSLYERLGGYDAIAAVTDDLLARLLNDPQLGGFGKATAKTVSEGTANWSSTTCARPQAARSSTRVAICRPSTKAWASAPMTGGALCGMPPPRWRNLRCR